MEITITWEISARAETECEGGNRCFLYLLLYTRVLRMRLWIFSPGWNFLSPITWGISARSAGLKISSRVAQTGLKFQPGSPNWNFLHVIANSVLQGYHRKPGMNFQPGQPGWKFIPGWKSPCNQPLKGCLHGGGPALLVGPLTMVGLALLSAFIWKISNPPRPDLGGPPLI